MPLRRVLLVGVLAICLARGQSPANANSPCATCHPRETANYTASSMGRSIGAPSPVPAGKITHAQSGSVITIGTSAGRMQHHLAENGLSATYPIALEIGAGLVGHSYVTRIGDFLLQSPASFYKRSGWDISPGFEAADLLDFNRVIGDACITCHSSGAAISAQHRLSGTPVAIGCERCHGDTSAHLRNPSAKPVNPAKLAIRERDSICEQCHLEGLARVLNPGKTLHDFHPGEAVETTWTTYVRGGDALPSNAVSHVEQLALSRCASQSNGKLWCGTCHDPHANPHLSANERHTEIRAICSSCHATLSKADHPAAVVECESCHMPRRSPTDVAHAAITDHRLLKRPGAATPPATTSQQLRAWHEPAPELVQRNLGLADIEASAQPGWASLGPAGAALLKQQTDPGAMTAAGSVYLAEGRLQEALPLLLRASQLEPANAQYALYAGLALRQSGDLDAAARELNRSIDLDPSLERAYLELSALLTRQHRPREAAAALDRYLKWNPQSILVRLTRDALP